MKIVNYILYFWRKQKNIKKALLESQDFLLNGTYQIYPDFSYLYGSNKLFDIKLNFIQQLIFLKKMEIKSTNKKYFSGTLVYINAQKKIKVFNNQEVVTFIDKQEVEKLFMIYDEVKNYFNIPKIIEQKNSYYIEEFITRDSTLQDKSKIIVNLFYILIDFYRQQTFTISQLKSKNIDLQNIKTENVDFIKCIANDLSELFPQIKSHNDIHFGNIIVNDKIYILDWEYYGENIFFYDFFNILFVEFLKGDKRYLIEFFNGELDLYFEELFEIFSIKFSKIDRKKYFKYYLVQRILLRDIYEEKVHLNNVLNSYKKIEEFLC